ncbi:hypothetical protein FSP39_015558 [Pinctada imbricata]|uniref:Uncharacterized protein n=1 Tax=Pinctada imbricata TaxID=66713 RepID=A0AA88Y433_PINIB|nr:hypothetical protein FSP39_015558 [Pinctada imbricata]
MLFKSRLKLRRPLYEDKATYRVTNLTRHPQQNPKTAYAKTQSRQAQKESQKGQGTPTHNTETSKLHINQRDQWATGADLGRSSATKIAEGVVILDLVENINTNPRRRSYRTANEMVSDSFRSYIYGLTPESSIYGTQETYLTSEERTRLGMNKVMKHASAQTEGMKSLPRCECIQEGDSYDYAMTCVVYQNVNPKTRNPYGKYFYKTSTDYSNPLYGEDYDDVMYKQKTKQDTDDNNYIDPNLINAKRSRKNRSKKKTNEHSSDSESEKEYVDKEFQKFARTLRWKRATQKRPEIDMQVEKSKSVPLQAPRPRKRKTVRSRGGKKGQYMRMKLTPELWEILRQQAKLMGDFEHKPYTKRNISNESLYDDGDENDEETSSASYDDADDTDFDYVDLTFGN